MPTMQPLFQEEELGCASTVTVLFEPPDVSEYETTLPVVAKTTGSYVPRLSLMWTLLALVRGADVV